MTLAPFHAQASSLKQAGLATHSRRLEKVPDGTWTTSSELVAELGKRVLDIRGECSPLAPGRKLLVGQCMRQVRKVWPGLGLLQGFPIRWLS